MGKRVLAIDLDPQGNMTSGLGVDKNDVENTVYELMLDECCLLYTSNYIKRNGYGWNSGYGRCSGENRCGSGENICIEGGSRNLCD